MKQRTYIKQGKYTICNTSSHSWFTVEACIRTRERNMEMVVTILLVTIVMCACKLNTNHFINKWLVFLLKYKLTLLTLLLKHSLKCNRLIHWWPSTLHISVCWLKIILFSPSMFSSENKFKQKYRMSDSLQLQ
jgi:hypothetical protein